MNKRKERSNKRARKHNQEKFEQQAQHAARAEAENVVLRQQLLELETQLDAHAAHIDKVCHDESR